MQLFRLFTPIIVSFTVVTAIKYYTIEIFCSQHTFNYCAYAGL